LSWKRVRWVVVIMMWWGVKCMVWWTDDLYDRRS
jgi:hypothetical protein